MTCTADILVCIQERWSSQRVGAWAWIRAGGWEGCSGFTCVGSYNVHSCSLPSGIPLDPPTVTLGSVIRHLGLGESGLNEDERGEGGDVTAVQYLSRGGIGCGM